MTHYEKQKAQSFINFRIDLSEAKKLRGAQFTIYDFINNSFYFSHTKKQLSIRILEALKEREQSFGELVKRFGAKKSTLYLLCLALERSGLIERDGKGKPFRLSKKFADAVTHYSSWWQSWVDAK